MDTYKFHIKHYIKSVKANNLEEALSKLTRKERRQEKKHGYCYTVVKEIRWFN